MFTLRLCAVLATLALFGACTTAGRGPAPHAGPGGCVMQPAGSEVLMSGTTNNPGGGVIYNPATGSTSDVGGAPRHSTMGYEAGGVVVPLRRVQR